MLAVVPTALAANAAPADPGDAAPGDIRELTRTDFTLDGQPVDVPSSYQGAAAQARSFNALAAAPTPEVGTVRQWLGLDDALGRLYRKDYTLRGVGNNIEVWVANDIAFPAGDCRLQIPSSTVITDAQVAYLVSEFDNNMYPKESEAFSVPPDRDGSNALLGPDANGNGGVYTGDGNKIVTLIDNVRDDNFYDFPAFPTYIAGFFSSQFNELFDRNVMTVDAYDWLHRTGANPPNEPTNDLCTSRSARPFLYEGVFAHEYQHLLHYYTDDFEAELINEGLSDFAQTLTGYVDSTKSVDELGADSHLFCYQGFGTVAGAGNVNPRDCGGPENSLNLWGEDQGNPNAVLADYGHAYSFMLYLYDRYGTDFMSGLHRDGDLQGIASIAAALEAQGTDLYTVLHNHQTMALVDRIVGDSRRGVVLGARKADVTTPSLRSTINLENPDINDDPGAAPNGADYVPLGSGRNLRSLSFEGAATLPTLPLEWTIVSNDADRPGNPVLWSGNGNNLDRSAVTEVAVPTADPTLRLLAKYGAEQGFDYGYVQVSTDGGQTYTSIAGDQTVDGPLGPSLNGTTTGFEPHTFDLSAYAGQTVLLSFRYTSDGSVNEGGLLIDDVTVGGTLISDGSSLDPFSSPTEINPVEVHNWNVKLVGIRQGAISLVQQAEYDGEFSLSLSRGQLLRFFPFDQVVAIVAYDEPTELVQQYAPYTLTVNGTVQPGG
jgi:hypothetical protein